MGARVLAALVVLLLASALLPRPASGSGRRVLEGDKSNSGQGAPAPAVSAGGSPKSDPPKESGQSSAAGQNAESHGQKSPPLAPPPPKDTKGKEGVDAQASASPPPPPPEETISANPPPGGPGPNGEGEPNGRTNPEDTGSQAKETDKTKEVMTDKTKEVMEKCDSSHKCFSGKEFSACLHVSDNAAVGSFVIVQNEGQNEINVTVKQQSNIDIDNQPLHLAKGAFGQMKITDIRPDGWNITLLGGKEECFIHAKQSIKRQSISDLQQQIQIFAAYASRLNPIYGASFFVFTVVLVSIVCVCCKFAKRRGNDEVPYQQLEMGAQAPNSAVVQNTSSTTDGWEDGWDDDWDDEEAPARPLDKKPTSSVSANGLSMRSQNNSRDGWDVDWDD